MAGRLRIGLSVAAALASTTAAAGDLTVTPVRLNLSPRQPIAAMSLRNAGSTPTSLQVRVFAWRQTDGEDRLEQTDVVLANPGAVDLAPGAEQLARVGLRSRSGADGGAYRVVIQELPTGRGEPSGAIATLLRISVPIFVEPANAQPRLAWSLVRDGAGAPALRIANSGDAHVQLTRLTLRGRGGESLMQAPVSFYVLPGAVRRLPLKLERAPRPGEVISLAAISDGPPLSAQIVVPSGGDDTPLR